MERSLVKQRKVSIMDLKKLAPWIIGLGAFWLVTKKSTTAPAGMRAEHAEITGMHMVSDMGQDITKPSVSTVIATVSYKYTGPAQTIKVVLIVGDPSHQAEVNQVVPLGIDYENVIQVPLLLDWGGGAFPAQVSIVSQANFLLATVPAGIVTVVSEGASIVSVVLSHSGMRSGMRRR